MFEGWPPGVDWSDHEFPASLDVADLACGTGTLLMAVASEMERRHREAGGEDAAGLHKVLVEQSLHGFDVQLSAIHFAATSLAMLNPEVQFDSMKLHVMPLGVDGEKTSLGSLDFLGEDEVAVQFSLQLDNSGTGGVFRGPTRVAGSGERGVAQGETARLPQLNLAIMNPPFTRSVGGNLLFGSVPKAQRRALQDELSSRLKSRLASSTGGLAAAFVAAAAPKLRRGEGRLALVLPGTVCTGPSWGKTRKLIEEEFVLDAVIVSHDPRRWNFSNSTDLSEALLIATRRAETANGSEHHTVFAHLWHNPDGVLDAHRVAQAMSTTTPANLEGQGTALLEVDGLHMGELLSMPESKILTRQWLGMQSARVDLTRTAITLLDDGHVQIPGEAETAEVTLIPLGKLGKIGPDRRGIADAFERTDSVTPYPMVEGHDTELRKSMAATVDTYLSPLVEPRGSHRRDYAERCGASQGVSSWLSACG